MDYNEAGHRTKTWLLAILMVLATLLMVGVMPRKDGAPSDLILHEHEDSAKQSSNSSAASDDATEKDESGHSFKVIEVIDGDTVKIDYFGNDELVRLIGINTPEVDGPYTTEECFGNESSKFAKEYLTNQWVAIERDYSQDNRDSYDRLLRYVFLDGADFGALSISKGYAREYTYDNPYAKRDDYIVAQSQAQAKGLGLWGACGDENSALIEEPPATVEPIQPITPVQPTAPQHVYGVNGDCNIKGNISYYGGQKIYHVPGQKYYDSTEIDESQGERWFCSESEAMAAGWRKSKE